LDESIYTIKKNTEALVVASKETGLEVNAEKTMYMGMSWYQNAGQIHSIKTDNKSFERVEQFRYLGAMLMNQNSIQEEIKSRLTPRNTCYHSVQNLLSSSFPSRNIKIKMQRTIILPVILYWCEAWSLTWWEECRLRVFENKVLRRKCGPRRDKVTGKWRRLLNKA